MSQCMMHDMNRYQNLIMISIDNVNVSLSQTNDSPARLSAIAGAGPGPVPGPGSGIQLQNLLIYIPNRRLPRPSSWASMTCLLIR